VSPFLLLGLPLVQAFQLVHAGLVIYLATVLPTRHEPGDPRSEYACDDPTDSDRSKQSEYVHPHIFRTRGGWHTRPRALLAGNPRLEEALDSLAGSRPLSRPQRQEGSPSLSRYGVAMHPAAELAWHLGSKRGQPSI
jgi:hypothetical protein